jgi:hypothetical protein
LALCLREISGECAGDGVSGPRAKIGDRCADMRMHGVGEDDDVSKIRNYVRESIKKIIPMNLSKDDLLDLLNSKGFGQLNA